MRWVGAALSAAIAIKAATLPGQGRRNVSRAFSVTETGWKTLGGQVSTLASTELAAHAQTKVCALIASHVPASAGAVLSVAATSKVFASTRRVLWANIRN